jgi:hypothetical protein
MSSNNFNGKAPLKFLSEIREHRNRPYFEDETVRIIGDIVSRLGPLFFNQVFS